MRPRVLVATGVAVLVVDPAQGGGKAAVRRGAGLEGHAPTCMAGDPLTPGRVWCGTYEGGLFRSDDGGESWSPAGLTGERLTAVAVSPVERGAVWAGTEPSAVWRSREGGPGWEPTSRLDTLPSSREWSFPPRPETHHVRWIACHPTDAGRLWVAVEAGALLSTFDGGRSWRDRVPGGPYDTHELALHPASPDVLRCAAGDGYLESRDGGGTWSSPSEGLDVGYLRSIAIDPGDPETVVVSASSRPRTAYVAGRSDGRVYRRQGEGGWERVAVGWPDPPATMAPLMVAGESAGELWAADERGVHRSVDGGASWRREAEFAEPPHNLRGLVALRSWG
jgi:photosystem II stability/assembly factor-like uncharacterized protein